MDTKAYISSGILEAYLLGALTPEEQAQVEAHVAAFPEVAGELRALEDAMLQYHEAQAVQPPPQLQEQIWNAIEAGHANGSPAQPKQQGKTRIIPFQPDYRKAMPWRYAALWIALAGSVFANLLFMYRTREEKVSKVELESRVGQLEVQQRALVALISDYEKGTDMMADTGMQTIVMHTMQKGHPMAATLYWSKDKGTAYVAMDALPKPPKGMQYQLWVIQDGKPIDMGVLPNSMANTPEIQKVDRIVTNGQAFAISLEKEGGSPTPTMENIYVLGKSS